MLAPCRSLLLVTLVAWCAACGGKSNADERDVTGGSSQGGGAGSANGGKPSAGSGTGGSSTGGGRGEAECEALLDDDGYYVPVSIINDSYETLFLGQEMVTCAASPLFDVADAEGRLLTPPGQCRSSCESAMSSGPSGCAAACLLPSTIELAPGDQISTGWAGTYIELVELPTQCQSAEFPSSQCDRAVAVEAGAFVFSAKAGTRIECRYPGAGCDPCTPDSSGACVTHDSLITGEIRQAEVEVELDASYGVGSGNADAAIRFVEIRFQNP